MSDFYRLADAIKARCERLLTIRREVAGYTRRIQQVDHPEQGRITLILYEWEDEIYRIFAFRGDDPGRLSILPLKAGFIAELIELCEKGEK